MATESVEGAENGSPLLRQFAEELRELKRVCGAPPLNEIKRRTTAQPSTSTISVLLAGRGARAPRWDLVSDVVTAMIAYARERGLKLDVHVHESGVWGLCDL
ncbi:hypothetical protein [Spirillospora sp. NPDC048819]|uniref:hypothetical protein n=1 Tax=Spirillospora sp. NPDC048819 TaxID=3155268 RepID=UPI00340E37B1